MTRENSIPPFKGQKIYVFALFLKKQPLFAAAY